jgi:hypothetical protein
MQVKNNHNSVREYIHCLFNDVVRFLDHITQSYSTVAENDLESTLIELAVT